MFPINWKLVEFRFEFINENLGQEFRIYPLASTSSCVMPACLTVGDAWSVPLVRAVTANFSVERTLKDPLHQHPQRCVSLQVVRSGLSASPSPVPRARSVTSMDHGAWIWDQPVRNYNAMIPCLSFFL